jgi:prepilin-type N-terminal cleavage/methylation domain-containing protein
MATPIDGPRSPRPVRGFTLIEIVVVLFILGVVVAMAAAVTTALTASQRLSTTTTRMAAIDAAIVQFVMQQRRLPCPADGRIATGAANAGVERRDPGTGQCNVNGAVGTVQYGVVPWVSLGLSETDATDGWIHRFSYRIPVTLSVDNALDMSLCDPAAYRTPAAFTAVGTAPNQTCGACTYAAIGTTCTLPLDFLSGKGLTVRNVAGITIMNPGGTPSTGAAYVVFSAGSCGGGAYTSNGVLSMSTTTDGTEEAKNYANLVLGAYYVDDSISDGAGASHFDDLVSRPALLTVINKAGLGPRSHS